MFSTLKQKVLSFVDYFIPDKNRQIDDITRIESLYITRLFVSVILFIIFGNSILTIDEFQRGFVTSPLTFFLALFDVALPLAALLLVKFTGKTKMVASVSIVLFIFLVSYFSLNLGTVRMATHWYGPIIISATFVVSRNFGLAILLFAVSAAITVSFDPLVRYNPEKIVWIFENRENSHLFELIIINGLIFTFSFVSSFAKDTIRAAIAEFKDNLLIDKTYELSQSKLYAIKNISAGVAHEINNPLAIIRAYITRLEKEVKDGTINLETLDKFSNSIYNSVNRITNITHSLGAFGTNIKKSNPSIHTINELAELVQEHVKKWLNKNELLDLLSIIEIKVTNGDQKFEAHIENLLIAISELVNNAVEASKDSPFPMVKICLSPENNLLKIEISNTNTNPNWNEQISDLEELSQPFFTTKSDKLRLGMGLTVAMNIVSYHQGMINFKNDNGLTTFTTTFPLTQPTKKKTQVLGLLK